MQREGPHSSNSGGTWSKVAGENDSHHGGRPRGPQNGRNYQKTQQGFRGQSDKAGEDNGSIVTSSIPPTMVVPTSVVQGMSFPIVESGHSTAVREPLPTMGQRKPMSYSHVVNKDAWGDSRRAYGGGVSGSGSGTGGGGYTDGTSSDRIDHRKPSAGPSNTAAGAGGSTRRPNGMNGPMHNKRYNNNNNNYNGSSGSGNATTIGSGGGGGGDNRTGSGYSNISGPSSYKDYHSKRKYNNNGNNSNNSNNNNNNNNSSSNSNNNSNQGTNSNNSTGIPINGNGSGSSKSINGSTNPSNNMSNINSNGNESNMNTTGMAINSSSSNNNNINTTNINNGNYKDCPGKTSFIIRLDETDEEICREAATKHYSRLTSIIINQTVNMYLHLLSIRNEALLNDHYFRESNYITATRTSATIEWLKNRTVEEQTDYFNRNPHLDRNILTALIALTTAKLQQPVVSVDKDTQVEASQSGWILSSLVSPSSSTSSLSSLSSSSGSGKMDTKAVVSAAVSNASSARTLPPPPPSAAAVAVTTTTTTSS